MHLVGGAATDTGRVRTANEDSVLLAEGVFAVADGMGGHRGGEVASTAALEAFNEAVGSGGTAQALLDGAVAANAAVYDLSSNDARLAGMGTTLVALAIVSEEGADRVAILNVGDSRVYLLSGDEFVQISEDHSLVETMVRTGQLSAEEASVHPRRNVLTRALGIEPAVDVDGWIVAPRTGDRFLLCSDGLFNELGPEEISGVLRRVLDPSEAAFELVRLANEAGGRDNISAVVVDVTEGDVTEGDGAAGHSVGQRVERFTEASDEQIIRGDDTQLYMAAPVPPAAGPAAATAASATDLSDPGDSLDALDVLSGSPAGSGEAPPPAPLPADDPAGPEPDRAEAPAPRRSERAAAPAEPARAPRRSEVLEAQAAAATAAGPRDKRFTWRVWMLLGAVVAVLVVAFIAVVVTGRSGYFLDSERGELVLYEGRRGGLLFIDPKRVEATGIELDDLAETYRSNVDEVTWTSRSDAERYIEDLRKYAQQGRERRAAASTTTTTTPAPPPTTTVVPGP